MNASTINKNSFTLKAGAAPVDGTVVYNSANNSAVFTPSAKLAYSTFYTAAITTAATDALGYSLTGSYTWSFTTLPLGKLSLSGFTTTAPLDIDSDGIIQGAARLTTADGKLTVDIAAGTRALGPDKTPLSSLSAAPVLAPPAAGSGQAIIIAYNLGLDGATFVPPLSLTIGYDPAKLPAGAAEKDLFLATFDGNQWQALQGSVDTQAKSITAKMAFISDFAALGKVPVAPPPTTVPPSPAPAPTTPPPPPATTPLKPSPTPPPVVTAAPTVTPVPTPEPAKTNWALIGGIIGAVVVIGIVVAVILIRRRRTHH